MDFNDLLTEEDLESLFDLKYASRSKFVENFPYGIGKDLPMYIHVLEFVFGSYGLLEPALRSTITGTMSKQLSSIKENAMLIKVPTTHNEYNHIFLRGGILSNIKTTLIDLLDSFFVPLEKIPLLINQKSHVIPQYIYRCRLEGILPLTDIDKNNYIPCLVRKNF